MYKRQSQLFQQDVRFAIEHTVALLDDRVSDSLGAVSYTHLDVYKRQGVTHVTQLMPARHLLIP